MDHLDYLMERYAARIGRPRPVGAVPCGCGGDPDFFDGERCMLCDGEGWVHAGDDDPCPDHVTRVADPAEHAAITENLRRQVDALEVDR